MLRSMTESTGEALVRAKAALAGDGSCEQALEKLVEAYERLRASRPPSSSTALRHADRSGLLANIIATIPQCVFWKDRNSIYQGCNEAFASVAGIGTPEEIVGKHDYDMVWKKAEADFFIEMDRQVMHSGAPRLRIVEPQRQADGRHRYLETSKVPLRDENGEVCGMLGIFSDITERKQMEEELLAAKEAAEASDRAKTDFLAAASHELRTPLTLILGPLETLMNAHASSADKGTYEVLRRIYRNASRLKVLTDDILDFSRGQDSLLAIEKEAVDIAPHLEKLIDDLAPAAEHKNIELTLRCEVTQEPVLMDIGKVDKIVMNLVGNALKFTPEGGSIQVHLQQQVDGFELSVTDSGIGIAEQDHPRLFNRFEQVEGGTTRKFGGTGLGLALVKQFAELMGGSVSVESALGQGATFRVILCREPSVSSAPPAEGLAADTVARLASIGSRTKPPARGPTLQDDGVRRPTVLIAEDNHDLRDYIASLLRPAYHVITVTDGQQAYEHAEGEHPDVIVSDVMMPRMDGIELVQRIKDNESLRTIPVLLLTARGSTEASAEGLDQGADDYITKPFSPEELLSRVAAAYRTHEIHRRLLDAQKRAAEAEHLAALGRLVAKLSHEINNPMNVIYNSSDVLVNYAELAVKLVQEFEERTTCKAEFQALLDEADWGFVREDLPLAAAQIRESAMRVRDIQSNFRHFLRGRAGSSRERCDINSLARTALENTRRARAGDLVLVSELAPSLPPLPLDPVRIGQVLQNLLNNAADAVQGDGTVVVRTRKDADELLVEVLDDGPGIQAEALSRIFEPFFTTKEVGQGTGLGLAICREIVDQHSGRIFAGNREPKGTKFTVALPLVGPSDGGGSRDSR